MKCLSATRFSTAIFLLCFMVLVSGCNSQDDVVKDDAAIFSEIGKEYDTVTASREDFPALVGEKLAFIAKKNRQNIIVIDGQEIGKDYDSVSNLKNIGGKLVFSATKDKKSFIVMEN